MGVAGTDAGRASKITFAGYILRIFFAPKQQTSKNMQV
jgi:hypothetical protein